MVTPEPSPTYSAKCPSPATPITPRHHSTSPTSSNVSQLDSFRIKPDSPPPSLAPAYCISSSATHTIAVSPTSNLSSYPSPFMAKLHTFESHPSTQEIAPTTFRADPSTPMCSPPPIHGQSSEGPDFVSDFPKTLARSSIGALYGGTGDIYDETQSNENARILETGPGRPHIINGFQCQLDGVQESSVLSPDVRPDGESLGIVDSPRKGRRLQLFNFKETSAESFEESLMTHGYGKYGEPRTQRGQISPSDGLSQEAIDWLTHNTPTGSSAGPPGPSELDTEPTERELRKRRRLEAFKTSSMAPSKLNIVQVQGIGRLVLDRSSDQIEELSSPAKKRLVVKRRKAAADKKSKLGARGLDCYPNEEPTWLDAEFPWNLREKERHEAGKVEAMERFKWIERFLDRDTDDDDAEEVNQEMLVSSAWDQGHQESSTTERDAVTDHPNVYFVRDPADARVALISKKSVRSLVQRRQHLSQNPRSSDQLIEGEVKCICGDGDDGTPQVQCDDCHMWYHLDCIGIRDEKDLGDEDDPWFCSNCVNHQDIRGSTLNPPTPAHREPTFAPTDDRPRSHATADIAFFQSSPHASPLRDWRAVPPQTPDRTSDLSRDIFSSRTVQDDGSGVGPSTPYHPFRHVHVFTTPGGRFDDFGGEDLSFDPTSTPTRGIKLGVPFVTPKSNWVPKAGGLMNNLRNGGAIGRNQSFTSFEDMGGSGGYFRNIYSCDDSPIRRAIGTGDAAHSPFRFHMLDSPVGSHWTPPDDSVDSFSMRSKGKGREQADNTLPSGGN